MTFSAVGHRTHRRRWFLKQRWMSFYSGPHSDPADTCTACEMGYWHFELAMAVSSFVYRRWPNLWRWWVNR